MNLSTIDRMRRHISIDLATGCWNWTGNKDEKGYGRMWFVDKVRRTHRVTYMLYKGLISEGREVNHDCDNKSCCNPDHLTEMTGYENFLLSNSLHAQHARMTHCAKGHPLTQHPKRNQRWCRICNLEQKKAAYYAKKGVHV